MEQNDGFLKNFGMIIPKEPVKIEDAVPDPNGVPIYAKCPSSGLCACTGRCRVIVGYDTDPEKVKAYHEDIAKQNEAMKEYRKRLFNNKWTDNPDGSKNMGILKS